MTQAYQDREAPGNAVTNETTYGSLTAVTATAYDSQGRAVSQTDALGNAVFTAYDRAGNVTAQWGAIYPVAYEYDTRGRRIAMATTRDDTFDFASVTNSSILNPNSSLDVTRWRYDAATGLLTNKVYADGARVRYTYTEGGRLATRVWSRGIAASYAYDALGQLTNVHYSGNTPDISFAYDRLGRMVSAITAVSSHLFEYAGLDLVGEIQDGVAITRSYDGLGRSTGFNIGDTYSTAYGYDDFGRFCSVSSSVCSVCSLVNYSRLLGTDLVASMTNSAGFWWQRTYEQNRNLISAVSNHVNHVNPVLISAYDYANDSAGRRVSRNADSFGYNARSEVIGAVIGTNNYGYAYDAIGNRVWSAVNTLTNSYTANCLNQYTAVTPPIAVAYDADGNMTYYGDWYHTWDAENRLTRSEPGWDGATNGAVMVDNRYDYRHRRCSKTVRRLSGRGASYPFDPSQGGTWDVVETRTFIYDGWNLTAEVVVDAQAGTTNVTRYLWGPDLSGTLQGAGGVGGLLAVIRPDGTFFPCYDANGNITDYVDSNGVVVAHREYDPFGRTIVATGPLVHNLHFWFSTKYLDEETGFYYYGYRFYSQNIGCFINRDPKQENLDSIQPEAESVLETENHDYRFLENNPLNLIEYLGLMAVVPKRPLPPKQHDHAEVIVEVSKCQILVVYGHNWRNKNHPRSGTGLETIRVVRAKDKDSPCAYAAVVGCFASYIPNEIPLSGYTPLAKDQGLNYSRGIGAETIEPDDVLESRKVLAAAKAAAKNMFGEPCCCKSVKFRVRTFGRTIGESIFGSIPNELAERDFTPEDIK